MSKNISIIAKNIKKFREKRGIFQDKLLKLAYITLDTITKIELGITSDPELKPSKKLPTL